MNNYYKKKSITNLPTSIAAFFSSFLFIAAGILIYCFSLMDQKPNIIDAILLWIGVGIFLFAGIYLFFYGFINIISNLRSGNKSMSTSSDNIVINTNPAVGWLSFIIGLIFTLTIFLFLYPKYIEGEVEQVDVIIFTVLAILLFIYALFILIFNLIKKRNKSVV